MAKYALRINDADVDKHQYVKSIGSMKSTRLKVVTVTFVMDAKSLFTRNYQANIIKKNGADSIDVYYMNSILRLLYLTVQSQRRRNTKLYMIRLCSIFIGRCDNITHAERWYEHH